MAFNYSHVLSSLSGGNARNASPSPNLAPPTLARQRTGSASSDRGERSISPPSRHACSSQPVLLHPLPASLTLEKESMAESELELQRQKEQRERERMLAEALQEHHHQIERLAAKDELGTWVGKPAKPEPGASVLDIERISKPFARAPDAYELYQAIDKHDLDFIARVRDHAFNLLLQKNATEFPIVYAARLGQSHRDIVVLLVGAFSRYVNNLDEEDFAKKDVRNTLKMLRANLKLAIDNALLPTMQSNLLSSYLQVLIMSEGDAWVHKATADLGLLLRDPGTHPVTEAESMVRKFSTRELRGVPGGVADVEEYIANATVDLVIMSAWGVAAGQMGVEPLPTYTFARDLRTHLLLDEAMTANKSKLAKVNRNVRFILNTVLDLGGDTRKSVRGRLRDIKEAIDGRV